MPTLIPKEECSSNALVLPKQDVIIFDRLRSAHEPRIRGLYADFLESFWIGEFSRNNLDRGGIGDKFSASDLLGLDPVLFVTELELVSLPPNWMEGIQLLENIRKIPGFKLVPPALVITNSKALCRAHHNFGRLNVRWAFTWKGLRLFSEQDRFRGIIRQLVRGH